MERSWELGPFTKLDSFNPVLEADPASQAEFELGGLVAWEAKDVFNPAAVVRKGIVHLFYRAEDHVGKHLGTSRIGLARSEDGISFSRDSIPVLFPAPDAQRQYEWEGGTEDPRICSTESGGYVMTYTAYDGERARLCIATSDDLMSWTKRGLAFPSMPDLWSKSGSIVCRVDGERLTAAKINGKYWMYWGESYIFVATSNDLVRWDPVIHSPASIKANQEGMPNAPDYLPRWSPDEVGHTVSERETLVAVMRPRPGRFDSVLAEPGPPAILTEQGIVLLYHGKNSADNGDPNLPPYTYSVGQVLLDGIDPTAVLERPTVPFLFPDRNYEKLGQVGNVCFAEGLARVGDHWLLYYGTADSKIAVARAPFAL